MDFISSTLLGWLAGKGLDSFANAASKSQFIRKALQENGFSLESKNSDFETLYVHTLIRFFVESELETRGYYPVFAEKEVRDIVHEAVISNNREEMAEEIEEVLVHGLKYKRKYKKLGKSKPTIQTFGKALDLFISVFNRLILEQAPIVQVLELHEQRRFWESSLENQEVLKQGQTELKQGQETIQEGQGKTQSKIEQLEARIAQLEEEKTFPHQIKKYLEHLRNDFQDQFLKPSPKYVPLIGHQKQETTVHPDRKEAAFIRGVIGEYEGEEITDKVHRKKWVEKKFDPIDNYFQTVLNQANPSHDFIVMLGEYGTGKTTFFKYLAYSLAFDYLEDEYSGTIKDPKKRIPILIPLRNYNGEGMEKFIISHLNEFGVTDLNRGALKNRLSNGEFIFLLDGFDEMISREAETRKKYHADILKDLVPKNEDSGSLVMLSSRIEYFKGENERDTIFGVKDSTNKVKVDFVHLNTFTDAQIRLFLERNRGKDTNVDELYEQIQTIFDLKDLAKRAVLLELIIKYLPTLMKKRDEDAGKIRSVELYREVFDKEIERVKKEKFEGRYFLKRKKKQMDLLRKLALQLYATNELVFTYKEAENSLCELMEYDDDVKRNQIETDLTKFLTFSFLLNDGENQYRFSHKSFRDYLVAEAHSQEIQTSQINEFGRRLNTDEVTTFISEFEPNTDTLEDWINDSQELGLDLEYRGTNAIKVMLSGEGRKTHLEGKVFLKARIEEIDFSGADLTGCVFGKSIFTNCVFDSNFFEVELKNSQVRGGGIAYWGKEIYDLPDNQKYYAVRNVPGWESKRKLNDITPLASFPEVEFLDFSFTEISDLGALAGLINLNSLDLSNTGVSDLGTLSGLINLLELELPEILRDSETFSKLQMSLPDVRVTFNE